MKNNCEPLKVHGALEESLLTSLPAKELSLLGIIINSNLSRSKHIINITSIRAAQKMRALRGVATELNMQC